jgi:hypothetical protein
MIDSPALDDPVVKLSARYVVNLSAQFASLKLNKEGPAIRITEDAYSAAEKTRSFFGPVVNRSARVVKVYTYVGVAFSVNYEFGTQPGLTTLPPLVYAAKAYVWSSISSELVTGKVNTPISPALKAPVAKSTASPPKPKPTGSA